MTIGKSPLHDNSSDDLALGPIASGDLAEVQRLTWELLDGGISQIDKSRLSRMLENSAAARETYISAVELHVNLIDIFDPGLQLGSGTRD